MRIFKGMNKEGKQVCPICKTQNDGEIVLVGIVGTQDDGIIEALPFHLECIELTYDPNAFRDYGLVYQRIS